MEDAVRRLRGPDAFASRDALDAFCAALCMTAAPTDTDGFVVSMLLLMSLIFAVVADFRWCLLSLDLLLCDRRGVSVHISLQAKSVHQSAAPGNFCLDTAPVVSSAERCDS